MDYRFAFGETRLDRAAHLRGTEGLASDPAARVLVFWRGKLLVGADGLPVLVTHAHEALTDARDAPIFLGRLGDTPLWAQTLTLWHPHEDAATIGQFVDASEQPHPAFPGANFVEVRSNLMSLDADYGEAIATARALTSWHETHGFCAKCGQPSVVEKSGWQRGCQSCGAMHFPRTDPVVIMAIVKNDRILLGRGPAWPERMYSALAGFIEPGETIEAAVRRETLEETGIVVGAVRPVANQPWPFPMSLMIGCIGTALSDEITIDPVEMADAKWLTRTEAMHMLAGTHPDIAPPRRGAIAGHLIEQWVSGKVTADGDR